MKESISLDLLSTQAENGFSLDELVVAIKEMFANKGFPALLEFILRCVDESVTIGFLSGKLEWRPQACCASPKYELQGRYPRTFKTTLGKVELQCRRLQCRSCGKKTVPLRDFMNWERYSRKTGELEKTVVEVVSEQSYRRSSRHLEDVGLVPVPKSTAHRWVMESSCDEIAKSSEDISQLFADGTGFKRRPDKAAGRNNRGEVRVALGITKGGRIQPFGAWSGASWEAISKEIKARLYDEDSGEYKAADCMIIDGESGLAEAMAGLANDQQRCHWHVVRDLHYTLWQEDAGKMERRIAAKNLSGILQLELPEGDFEKVRDEDKAALRDKLRESESQLREFSRELLMKGYDKAANHISKASARLFTYARFWLKTGVVLPRVTSWIERIMREIGRRIKKIGFGWSEEGAAKMTRILLRRLNAEEWKAYWEEKLQLKGRSQVTFLGVKSTSTS